jgi:hypothetical protein
MEGAKHGRLEGWMENHAFRAAKQIADVDLERLDTVAYKLKNGLKRSIESL